MWNAAPVVALWLAFLSAEWAWESSAVLFVMATAFLTISTLIYGFVMWLSHVVTKELDNIRG